MQIDQAFYGLSFSPDGKQLFASGGEFEVVHVFDFDRGYLVKGRAIDVSDRQGNRKGVVGGMAFDATGRDLFVAAPWGDAVVRVPLVNPDNKKVIPMVAVAAKKEPGKGEPPSPPDGRKEPKEKAADDPTAKAEEPASSIRMPASSEPGGKRRSSGSGRRPRSRSSTWRRTPSSRPGRPPNTRPRWSCRRRARRCTSPVPTRRR